MLWVVFALLVHVRPAAVPYALPRRHDVSRLSRHVFVTPDATQVMPSNAHFCCSFSDEIGNIRIIESGSKDEKYFVNPQTANSDVLMDLLRTSGKVVGNESAQYHVELSSVRSANPDASINWSTTFLVFASDPMEAKEICEILVKSSNIGWLLGLIIFSIILFYVKMRKSNGIDPLKCKFSIVDEDMNFLVGKPLDEEAIFERGLLKKTVEATIRDNKARSITMRLHRKKDSYLFDKYLTKYLGNGYVLMVAYTMEYGCDMKDIFSFSVNSKYQVSNEKVVCQSLVDESPYKYSFEIDDPEKTLINVKEGPVTPQETGASESQTFIKRLSDTKYEITFCPSHFSMAPFLPQGPMISVMLSLFYEIVGGLEHNPYKETNYIRAINVIMEKLEIDRTLLFTLKKSGKAKLILEQNKKGFENIGVCDELLEYAKQVDNGYKYFDDILPGCEKVVIARLTTKDDVFVVYGIQKGNHEYFEDRILPVFAMTAVVIYQFTASHRRYSRYSRLLSIFETSKIFSYFEVTRNRILSYRSTLDVHKGMDMSLQKLVEMTSRVEPEQAKLFREKLERLWEDGTPITQMIMTDITDTPKHFALNCNRVWDQQINEHVVNIFVEDVTDIKEQEIGLIEAHKQLQLANNSLGLHKFTISSEGEVILTDDKLFEELGVPVTKGRILIPIIVKEDLASLQSRGSVSYIKLSGARVSQGMTQSVTAMRRNLELEASRNEEKDRMNASSLTIRLMDGKGGYSWYSMVSDGKTGFIFSVDSTVTMRRQLQTTEKSLKMASMASGFTFWGVDITTDKVERLLKYDTVWDAIGNVDQNAPFTRMIDHVIDGKEDIQKMFSDMRGGALQSWNGDLLIETVKGKKWFRMVVSASSKDHFNCFMLDITEQKDMEVQLLRSQELRDMILSSAKIYLWTFDDDDSGSSIIASPQLHTMQMNWKFVSTEVAEETRSEFTEAVKQAFRDRSGIDAVVLVGDCYFNVRGKWDEEGNRLVGICCDITEMKKAFNDLAREQERAQAANKAKSIFLANMSHEIRTPLNGIIGMLDILAMHELSFEQRLLTDAIRSSSFELMKQLTQTLNMSRIERGKFEFNNEIFDISKSLEAVAVAAATRAKMNNLQLKFRVSPSFPNLIYGEPQIFLQIVNNLISNALKFTKSGSVGLNVRWEIEPQEQLLLDVIDTGIGMSDEQKQVIFRRFSQADPSVARYYGGTGLGLALVQDLIAQLGGSITFDSELGKGTQFHVKLPFISVAFPYPLAFDTNARHIIAIATSSNRDEFVHDFIMFYKYEVLYIETEADLKTKLTKDVDALLVDIEWYKGDINALKEFMKREYPNVATCSIAFPGFASDFPCSITKPVLPLPMREFLFNLRYHRVAKERPVEKVASDDISGKKILVVEDNATNQFVMSKMLTKLKLEYKIANNGEHALEVLEDNEFDLIFMDCQMPVMDGLEATKRIRAAGDKSYHDVPIVALTASAIEGDEEQCKRAGMNGYLAKPVRIQQITDAIKKFALTGV